MAGRRADANRTQPHDLPRFLVWVRGLEGPELQKWTALDFGIGDWKRAQVLAWRELPEEERSLSLSRLARRYPPPQLEANDE